MVLQLRTEVAVVMAAVRALPPMSMDAVGAAARLALPQIGCSNIRSGASCTQVAICDIAHIGGYHALTHKCIVA